MQKTTTTTKKTCPQIFTAARFTVAKRQKESGGLRRSGRCPGRPHAQRGSRGEKGDNSIFPLGVSRSMAGRASHSVPLIPHGTPFPSHCPLHPPFQLRSEPQLSASQTPLPAHTPVCAEVSLSQAGCRSRRGAGPFQQVSSLSRSLQQTLEGGRGRRKERSVHRDSAFAVREALRPGI